MKHAVRFIAIELFLPPHSLSAVQVLSNELLKVAPMLEPCTEAMEEALRHVLNNYHHIQSIDSSGLVFNEAAMIVLSCVNITLDDLFSIVGGDLSSINHGSFLDMVNDAVKAMIHMKLFGDDPMVYQAHEQFLASSARKALMQKVAEMSAMLASSNESGLELLTQALPRISELLRPLLSTLTQMGVDLPEITELIEKLVENIIAMLRHLLSDGLFTPEDHHPGVTHVSNARRRREAPLLPQSDPMNDFLYFLSIDYPAMFSRLSVPSQEEIRETAHMFFSNPNLNIIMKGSTRDMPWVLNSSREETIDAALGVLSFATLPSDAQM